jgi:hypothetical protein
MAEYPMWGNVKKAGEDEEDYQRREIRERALIQYYDYEHARVHFQVHLHADRGGQSRRGGRGVQQKEFGRYRFPPEKDIQGQKERAEGIQILES